MHAAGRGLLFVVASLGATGCLRDPKVSRVYDGKLVEEKYVTPDAYAAFLRGVLAEEAGDYKGAITAYQQALEEDDDDPEIWTRLGETRCRQAPNDAEADRAFARALKLDPASASAHAANARCLVARGRGDEAAAFAAKAASLDPGNVALEALHLRAQAGVSSPSPAARERVLALTLAHREHAAAWDALVAWGRARRDPELLARGLEGLLRVAPSRSAEVEAGAVLLLEAGHLPLARRLAAAIADAPRDLEVRGPRDATVARLAVDEALARGVREAALARATRGHVPLAEVAARALLLDQKEIATSVVTAQIDADPNASGAQMVRAALRTAPPTTAPRAPDVLARVTDRPPEICALVFADRLAATAGNEVARDWLARITWTPMALRDPLATPLARDLTARGVRAPDGAGAAPAEQRTSGR